MVGPRIVTALVLISMSAVGCKAKFQSVNKPPQPSANAVGPNPPPTNNNPQGPQGPEVPPPQQPPPSPPPSGPVTPPPTLPPSPPPQPPQPPPNNSCPTQNDVSLDRSGRIYYQTVYFARGNQLVERRDCYNRVVSKGYENIGDNTVKTVTIGAVGGQGPMSVFNRSTCHATQAQNQLMCDSGGRYSFTISTRKSNGAMYVRPGVNFIDFKAAGHHGTLVLTVQEDQSPSDCIVIRPSNCR